MKAQFTLILYLLLSQVASGHNIRGGTIGWTDIGKDSFLVKLELYHECGTSFHNEAVTATSNCGIKSIAMKLVDSKDVTPLCYKACKPCKSSSCTFKHGTEKRVYESVFDASSWVKFGCCEITLSYSHCCRAASTTLSSTPSTFYISSKLNACYDTMNSLVWYLEPSFINCLGRDQMFNVGGTTGNPDDSIVYSWGELVTGTTSKVFWKKPYAYDKPFGSCMRIGGKIKCLITLDSGTGQIVGKPMREMTAIAKIQADIYRKGKRIATVDREFTVMVIKCPENNPPVISGFNITTLTPASSTIELCPGQIFCAKVVATDKDKDSTQINYFGNIPGLKVTHLGAGKSKYDTLLICWKPDSIHIRKAPYSFLIQAKDNHCPVLGESSRVFSIYVKGKPDSLKFKDAFQQTNCDVYNLRITEANQIYKYPIQWTVNGKAAGNLYTQPFTFGDTGLYKIRAEINHCYESIFEKNIRIRYLNTLQWNPLLGDTTLCAGDSLKVEAKASGANGTLSYQWQTDPNSNSPELNQAWLTAGFKNHLNTGYSSIDVTATDTAGCHISQQIRVNLRYTIFNDLLADTQICSNDKAILALSGSSNAGSWTGVGAIGSDSVYLDTSLRRPHPYLFKYVLLDSPSCAMDYAHIGYHKLPQIGLPSPFSICQYADSVPINATPPGGKWLTPGINQGYFNPATFGTGSQLVVYSYTNSSACSSTDSFNINVVNYRPSITIDKLVSLCQNHQDSTLKGLPLSGNWIQSNSNKMLVSPDKMAIGHYYLKFEVTDSNQCYNVDSTLLVIQKVPWAQFSVLSPDTIQQGDSIKVKNLSDNQTGTKSYWLVGNPPIATSNDFSPGLIGSQLGTHDIVLINSSKNGCTDSMRIAGGITIVKAIGSDKYPMALAFYPNPVNDLLHLNIENGLVSVFDMAGNEVMPYMQVSRQSGINVSVLPPGIYLLRATTEANTYQAIMVKN